MWNTWGEWHGQRSIWALNPTGRHWRSNPSDDTFDTIKFTFSKDHTKHTMNDEWCGERYWKATVWTNTGKRWRGEHGCEKNLKLEANWLCFTGSYMGWPRWKVVLIIEWEEKPRVLTPVHLNYRSVPPLWQLALTMGTDLRKVYRGSFLVHIVADHTGEDGTGLTQRQVHSQLPGVGG